MNWFVYEHTNEKGYRVVGATDAERSGAETLFREWLPYRAVPEAAAIVGHHRFAESLWFVVVKPAGTNSIHAMMADRATYERVDFSPFSLSLGAPCGASLVFGAIPGPPLCWAGVAHYRLAIGDDSYLELAQRLFIGLEKAARLQDYISALPLRGTARQSQFSRFELREGAVFDRAQAAILLRPLLAEKEVIDRFGVEKNAISRVAGDLTAFREDVQHRLDALIKKIPAPGSGPDGPAVSGRVDKLEERLATLEAARPSAPTLTGRVQVRFRLADWLFAGLFAVLLLAAVAQYSFISVPIGNQVADASGGLKSADSKIEEMTGQLAQVASSLGTLELHLAKLESQFTAAVGDASVAQLMGEISKATNGIGELRLQLDGIMHDAPPKTTFASLSARAGEAATGIDVLNQKFGPLQSTVDSLTKSVAKLEGADEFIKQAKIDFANIEMRLTALDGGAPANISLASLKTDLDAVRGVLAPFMGAAPTSTLGDLVEQVKRLSDHIECLDPTTPDVAGRCNRNQAPRVRPGK
jgi:hypothetical protein